MNPEPQVTVLGAGLAGLSCAHEISRHGSRVRVLEKEPVIGGFAKSLHKDGFTLDLGPHRFHSEKGYLVEHLSDLLGGDLIHEVRHTQIYLQGKLFDYPLKAGSILRTMPPGIMAAVLRDYFRVKARNVFFRPPDDSFETWVVNRFGWKLYGIFFKEYTEKTWGIPCTEISSDWAVQRISLLSLWDTIKHTLFKFMAKPRTYVSRFYYPRVGGIGRICDEYASGLDAHGGEILRGADIEQIWLEPGSGRIEEIVYRRDGGLHRENPGFVMSTIPVTSLVSLLRPRPPFPVVEAARRLIFNSIIFVYLVLDRKQFSPCQWIYLPERRFFNNRISEPKNFSPLNGPEDRTVICAEITCREGDEVWSLPEEELYRRVVKDVLALGFSDVEEKDITHLFTYRMPNSYPIYTLDYKDHYLVLERYLDSVKNLLYFGRNALFRYNNMDHSIDMGLKAAAGYLGNKVSYIKEIATEQKWFG